jgi:hypothetical protein
MSKDRTEIARRDATGHMDPQYQRELLEESNKNRSEHGSESAFSYRPRSGDELGEGLGEGFIESATSGEGAEPERHERVIPEEQGGPFVRSNSSIEFASGTDASNIEGATREAFPTTSKATSWD